MPIADDIMTATKSVTKEWTHQRKAEERFHRSKRHRATIYSTRINFTDVAPEILPAAYDHASGGGKHPVSARQIYYAAREAFRERTGHEISQAALDRILTQFINRNPELTASWDITRDSRGTLTIPNADHHVRIPCGTVSIRDHLRAASQSADPLGVDAGISTRWPSLREHQRYQAILYIEKEGFEPLLESARIAERFDLAILSCKGQSNTAARMLVDEVCALGEGVPLFVLHDFDKYGFEISQRLTTVSEEMVEKDTCKYFFLNKIEVTDLGLRLEHVEKYGLASEHCKFRGHFAKDSICTDEEKAFLRSQRRVELNAFTSPQFIEWLESLLAAHLPNRLIPRDEILEAAYRRALATAAINQAITNAQSTAMESARRAVVPKDIGEQVAARVAETSEAWDVAVYEIAKGEI